MTAIVRGVLDVAREMAAILRAGLDATGGTEAHFLDALDAIIACGQSPAAEQLRIYDAFAY